MTFNRIAFLLHTPHALRVVAKRKRRTMLFFGLGILLTTANAQQPLTLEEAVQTALSKNEGLKSAESQVDYYKNLKRTSTDIGKLSAVWMHGQYNSVYQDNNLTVMQTIPFPTALGSQWQLGKEQVSGAEKSLQSDRNTLVLEVKSTYFQLLYLKSLATLLQTQDSLFSEFAKAAALRFSTGEGNLLEKTTAATQSLEVVNLARQNLADIAIAEAHLQALLKNETPVTTSDVFQKRALPSTIVNSVDGNPQLAFLRQQVTIRNQLTRVERNRILPDISLGYFVQSLTGLQNVNGQDIFYTRSKHFQGFELGLSIPFWIVPQVARVRAAASYAEAARRAADYYQTTLASHYEQALRELDKDLASLTYYEDSALPNASLILAQARRSYTGGEIGYVEYLQSLKNVISIRSNYLMSLNLYNQSVVKIEFLIGKL
jgi:cobalt-zinc-cadmium resistance protein CzcA